MAQKTREVGLTTSPSGSWVQVERVAMERWAQLAIKCPRAASIMMVITSKMGRSNALVISQRTLSQIAECSRSTLVRSLELLQRENWIDIRQIGPSGTVNAYIVNDRVAWQGNRDGKRFSLFSATVLLSENEQPDKEELEQLEKLERIPEMFSGEMQLPHGEGLPPPSQPALPGMEMELPARRIDDDFSLDQSIQLKK